MKRTISILLTAVMLLSMFTFVFAEDPEVTPTSPTEVTQTPPLTENPAVTNAPTLEGSKSKTFEYTQKTTSGENTVKVEVEEKISSDSTNPEVTIVEEDIKITEGGTTVTEHEAGLSKGENSIVQENNDGKKAVQFLGLKVKEQLTAGTSPSCTHASLQCTETRQTKTCQVCGLYVYKCDTCSATFLVEEDPSGHEHGETSVKTVGCAENRYYIYNCTECSENYIEYDANIPAENHDFDKGVCKKCGYVNYVSGEIKTSGTTNAEYSFAGDTLTVDKGSGNGEIPDYSVETTCGTEKVVQDASVATPWYSFAERILHLIIGNGITRIGDFAFANLTNLQDTYIEGSNVSVGDYAFANDGNLLDVNLTAPAAIANYDNANSVVKETNSNGDVVARDTGSTAYADDGYVEENFRCINPNAASQKSSHKFALATVAHEDLHADCITIPGYQPTEKEFGLTDGIYCRECNKMISPQYKIYPNGKAETGEYKVTDFKKLKEIPEILKKTKYNNLEKLSELIENFKKSLAEVFRKEFKSELLKDNYKIYDIELVELKTAVKPEKHIVNIPYPTGTWPDGYDYVLVQLTEDDKFEEVDSFKTNKGLQIEVKTLMPVGVACKAK